MNGAGWRPAITMNRKFSAISLLFQPEKEIPRGWRNDDAVRAVDGR
jgi:hypothetical protein